MVPLWIQIKSLLKKIDNSITISPEGIVYNVLPSHKVNNLLLICLAERWAIWHCRNLFTFQEHNVNDMIFINHIKLKIKADFKRLEISKFKKVSCNNDIFVSLRMRNVNVILKNLNYYICKAP